LKEEALELTDTVAIVTGAARGIGRGIALGLAREGAHVVVADLPSVQSDMEETQRQVEALGVQAHLVHADVRDEAQVQAMAQAAIDRFGRIDVLVNNAGVIGVAPVVAMTEEQWDFVIDVNLKGTFLCSKAVIPHMAGRRSGRIVNLSSLAGRRGSAALSHYCTSKFGVIGFTQSLALEVAGSGIAVNAVCPGFVDSAMWREVLLPALSAAGGNSADEAWQAFVKQRMPLGRAQTVDDIAQAVVFLCRADNITGEAINVTGGAELT
jgi:meso-butanediol dehydrogenase/(S,S)-butanediol dehydrogenase/diacetyl reductase